jgi:Holliday junction resolvase-like predicted endonuclease
LLEVFAHIGSSSAEQIFRQLRVAFNNQDIERTVELIKQLFAHVPYQLHSKEEKFYHALLMMACIGAGIDAQSEYSTSLGRIDLVLNLPRLIYVIEVKFNSSAENALEQIKERRYYERFVATNKSVILLGLAFTRAPHHFDVTYAMEALQ